MKRLFGRRGTRKAVRAALARRNYAATARILTQCKTPIAFLWRYLTGRGGYPWDIEVRTPTGDLRISLFHPHDVVTVNEIFFRRDYPPPSQLRTAVDIGGNIGVSACFFLSRNATTFVYIFEPNPDNLPKLQTNVAPFADRVHIEDVAVASSDGDFEFGVEPSGRYGSLQSTGLPTTIFVRGREINSVLRAVLARSGPIDLLKIDTEGTEAELVSSIDASMLTNIHAIYFEAKDFVQLRHPRYRIRRGGDVVQMTDESSH